MTPTQEADILDGLREYAMSKNVVVLTATQQGPIRGRQADGLVIDDANFRLAPPKRMSVEYLELMELALNYDLAMTSNVVKHTEAIYAGHIPFALRDRLACFGMTADILADDGNELLVQFHGDERPYLLPRLLFWIPTENPHAKGVKKYVLA